MLAIVVALSLGQPPVPVAPPPRPIGLPTDLDPALADWTPRPPRGKGEPWELMTDKDWIDPRFRLMDTGPALNCTMRYPLGKGHETVFKATAVKLGDKGGVVFDRATMRLAAGWTGGYLDHSDRRFGLLNTPTPKGEVLLAKPAEPGWVAPKSTRDAPNKPFTAPLPQDWVRYRGHHLNGGRVVFRYAVGNTDVRDTITPWTGIDAPGFVRTIQLDPGDEVTLRLPNLGGMSRSSATDGFHYFHLGANGRTPQSLVFLISKATSSINISGDGEAKLILRKRTAPVVFSLVLVNGPLSSLPSSDALRLLNNLQAEFVSIGPGEKRWGVPIVTKLERGAADGPFAVDTLTLPYKNPFNALFFCTGLDFLPDGRVAVCTCHGDVWLAKIDEAANTVSWQRFATGLYHPLGLKVVEGKVVVLERGQLTRLHDLNADGEADYYECISNDWDTGAGEHSYDTCLETDPAGNFYFFKTGDTNLPTGGCLMKVAKDGSKAEVFATGFRHPIGMGMSPTGILTGADQEGNWMPATRVDEYKKGGFYGDMRAHHRKEPPKIYDGPLCWLPREVDNSAGGQVWVPPGTFGPLAGLPLHLSYGRCRPFVLLRQELTDGRVQGGVAGLPVKFLSGVCRARFNPADGQMYVCGLNGWQTAAQADGCVQRVRLTGKPLDTPVNMAVDRDTIRLTFSRAMDAAACADANSFKAAAWNYRWEASYGSKRWKPSNLKLEGQDDVPVKSAKLLDDGKTVELRFGKLQPVMQMQVGYNVAAGDGAKVFGSVYLTIHSTRKER